MRIKPSDFEFKRAKHCLPQRTFPRVFYYLSSERNIFQQQRNRLFRKDFIYFRVKAVVYRAENLVLGNTELSVHKLFADWLTRSAREY